MPDKLVDPALSGSQRSSPTKPAMSSIAIEPTAFRPAPAGASPPAGRTRWSVLRVPLFWKVLGANLVLVLGMGIAHLILPDPSPAVELAILLVLNFSITGFLVWLALRPLFSLETTAKRVTDGDFSARAPRSPLADRQMLSLTSTMNRLLDRVEADRARIHYLAGRGVRAREIEREAVARELRESFSQTLTGIAMQLAAVERMHAGNGMAESLQSTRAMIQDVTEEMRSVAETLYPGTLSQLGLVNAIEALARRVSRRSGLVVEVEAACVARDTLPPPAASALYRVAEEALRNVEQHGHARNALVTLTCNAHVELTVEDDGRGIEMRENDPLQAGLGLFSAKAVLALSGGELQISSGPGLGTRVTARVPLDAHQGKAQ